MMMPESLLTRFQQVRTHSLRVIDGLSAEDCQAQSMPEASPLKWHLAHTTWFFETFVLERFEPGFRPVQPAYRTLYNSYYHAVGERAPRPQRGLITRPSLQDVLHYRQTVDDRVAQLLCQSLVTLEPASAQALGERLELGLQHEQQHQELMHTDLLHLFSLNPLRPACQTQPAKAPGPANPMPSALQGQPQAGGLVEIGHAGAGFCFDNETPRHRRFLEPYALSQRLVTQGEWMAFMRDGGYQEVRWWLSAGWDWLQREGIQSPLYWARGGGGDTSADDSWTRHTLHGPADLQPDAPMNHLSLYEADAFCRWLGAQGKAWAGARLPTEAEWEAAATAAGASALQQLWNTAWQWTSSSYDAYPGYRPWSGDVGEYNGKFMANQYVLRGGSCVTPQGHVRPTYRNFFPADTRWQFTGLRVARSLG